MQVTNASVKRYRVGRSERCADILIDDPDLSVSSLHAELSRHQDGRWFLTDCSANGTYVYRRGRWKPLNRGFVTLGERLSFGKRVVDVSWLLGQAERVDRGIVPRIRWADAIKLLPSGRYVRDPTTGEIHWRMRE